MNFNPLYLFTFLSLVSICHFVLGWYTKLFTLSVFSYKVAIKTHAYFTILYILCFLFTLFIWFLNWYANILTDIALIASHNIITHPDFNTLFPELSESNTEINSNLETNVDSCKQDLQINTNPAKQDINVSTQVEKN